MLARRRPWNESGPSTGPDLHMRMRGLEPPRPERHTDLNRARLPIPPHRARRDSSRRRRGYRHAARQPPVRIGVTPIVNRVFALLCALGLCCLASACGSAGHRAASASDASRAARSSSRSRLLPWRAARARAAGPRAPRSTGEQARFAAALHDAIPERPDPLAVPARAQRRGRRRSEQRGRPPADAPRRAGGRRRRRRTRVSKLTAADSREGRRDLADGSHESGRRHQDRDHRRRRRPDPPVLRPGRLHDAGRLPEGPDCVHDGQGDRRPCVRAGRDHVEVRAQALRPGPVRARNPRRGDRRRERRHRRRPAASRSPASRPGPTSATTRR